ncbi:MAG TPA: hypothetical protein VIJ78_04070 [Pseudolabrys sp.]
MRRREFTAGVTDFRAGKAPRFDVTEPQWRHWEYERGRLWATIAPRSLLLTLAGRLNPKAIDLFWAHDKDICPEALVDQKELLS